jgi:hypothetical protein
VTATATSVRLWGMRMSQCSRIRLGSWEEGLEPLTNASEAELAARAHANERDRRDDARARRAR